MTVTELRLFDAGPMDEQRYGVVRGVCAPREQPAQVVAPPVPRRARIDESLESVRVLLVRVELEKHAVDFCRVLTPSGARENARPGCNERVLPGGCQIAQPPERVFDELREFGRCAGEHGTRFERQE